MKKSLMSSLMKKFVMAVTGFVLAAFLLVHMLGNLQTLEGCPTAINVYAHTLQTLPWEFLWGFRAVLALCFVLHFSMAFLLVLENNKARPQKYAVRKYLVATPAARSMIYTGVVVIAFILIHILHYTVLKLNPEFKQLDWVATSGIYEGKTLHDVYAMMILGFSNVWVSLGYIVAMVIIAIHLSHGVSSMFQSIGIRDEAWRYRLNAVATAYCAIIALGFSLNPIAVLASKYTPCKLLPVDCVIKQYEAQKNAGKEQIFINYDFLKKDSCKPCAAISAPKAPAVPAAPVAPKTK